MSSATILLSTLRIKFALKHIKRVGIRLKVFLFLDKNIFCGYSLEAPHQGTSNEYPQHMFSLRNKKTIDTFWLKKGLSKSYVLIEAIAVSIQKMFRCKKKKKILFYPYPELLI